MKKLGNELVHASILTLAILSAACGGSSGDEVLGRSARSSGRGATDESGDVTAGKDAPPAPAASEGTAGAPAAAASSEGAAAEAAGPVPGAPFVGSVDGPSYAGSNDPAPVYREVYGWSGWLCADLGEVLPSRELVSSWYVVARGGTTAALYKGSCAALSTDPDKARYGDVPGWPEYKCATLPDGNSSMWFVIGRGVRTAVRTTGSCASWARSY